MQKNWWGLKSALDFGSDVYRLCWIESKRSHWARFETLLAFITFIKYLVLKIALVLGADLIKDSRKN